MGKWNAEANELFLKASELDSPEQVGEFLSKACGGDVELRAEV